MKSFGEQLRVYRRQCIDPQRGGLLTQECLGELMGTLMGDKGYSGAAVSDWERNKSKIHADDRSTLVALLTVLTECGGIGDSEEANEMLAAGNYRRLNQEEMGTVFPDMGRNEAQSARSGSESMSQSIVSRAAAEQEAVVRERNQCILLDKVESFWVDGVLKKSTASATVLSLNKAVVDGAVDHPWDESLGPALIADESSGENDIGTLFMHSDRALLILGSPGCGKTMTLIALAESLLERARRDPQAAVPVILDLSGWANERRDLGDWIVEELTSKYQIPRRYGRRWLDDDELILLLDGFDVLPLAARGPCVMAVNRFRESSGLTGLAVCSRSEEYLSSGFKFRLNRCVKIQQLDQNQIDIYLSGDEHIALKKMIDVDPAFHLLAQSPLMLSVLAEVASDDPAEGSADAIVPAAGFSNEGESGRVFDAYTRHMFGRRPPYEPYGPAQTVKYLHWLAGRMDEHSQSIFLIEGIQPSWLPSKRWRWLYMLLSGLILGSAGGLIMWLLWRILRYALPQLQAAVSMWLADLLHLSRDPVELLTILLGNLFLGLLAAAILGVFFERRRLEPVGAEKVERQRWVQVWTVGLICGLVTTLFVSLFSNWLLSLAWGVAEGFMYMAAARFIFGWSYESDVRPVEALGWSWRRSLTGMGVGLILVFISETLEYLLFGYNGFGRTLVTLLLAGFIFGGLSGSTVLAKNRPNQGVWLSLRNAGIAAVVLAFPLTVATGLMRDIRYGVMIGMLSATIAAALFGAGVFAKHFLLRGLLRLQHSLPWRYSRFLDHAAQLVFLRKVGGGYIFMHRLLQQYFAEQQLNGDQRREIDSL